MNRYFIDLGGLRERASASPDPQEAGPRPVLRPSRSRDQTRDQARDHARDQSLEGEATLHGCQVWFARAVATPESEPAAVTDEQAARVLTAGPRQSAIERLEIYRRAYHARLIECLADDYPVLSHALGEAAFEGLCRAYIESHPSTGPSLNVFGRLMAEFCGGAAPLPEARRAFAADLAALEWAIVEVIHAPSAEPLTLEALRNVPPDAWAEVRLVPNSAFRLLRFEYPVNRYFQALRGGGAPEISPAEPSATVVYRSGPTVWRMDLTVAMFDVLSSLADGETLAASLGRAEASMADVDEEEAGRRVMGWFREWVGSGLFARVVPASPSSRDESSP